MSSVDGDGTTRGSWDGLAADLQAFRSTAGSPSYAEIARRISDRRQADGADPHAARVARTTVYDAFRPGRARPNLEFVREIGRALGADHDQVDGWISGRTATDPVPVVERAGTRWILLLLAGCIGFNLAGRVTVDSLHLPIYLDMTGTAVAAMALGPWFGAVVGALTNLVGVATSGWESAPFALVNVAGALVWGYGVRRFAMGRTLLRFLLLNVLVAAVCSLVAVPILVALFDGTVGQGQDDITDTFLALTDRLAVAVGFSNSITSLGDKLISGFLALVAVTALPVNLRAGLQVVTLGDPNPPSSPARP